MHTNKTRVSVVTLITTVSGLKGKKHLIQSTHLATSGPVV